MSDTVSTPVVVGDKAADLGASVVRTIVLPAVLAVATSVGLDAASIDLGSFQLLAELAVGYAGYTVVRALEVYSSPKWGYILGLPGHPTYPGKK